MGLFKRNKGSKNWQQLQERDRNVTGKSRDVHSAQSLERGVRDEVEPKTKERVFAVIIAIFFGGVGFVLIRALMVVVAFFRFVRTSGGDSFLNFKLSEIVTSNDWRVYVGTAVITFLAWAVARERMMMAWRSRNSMADTSDINTYENDQHVMLFEEMQQAFDWFPDTGAHSSVQVSSMLSHMMIDKKGLKSVPVTKRYEKDVVIDGEIVAYKGEPILDDDGNIVTETSPIIDEAFGQDLFTASSIGLHEKDIRKPFDVRKIPYNPVVDGGVRLSRSKLNYDTVKDLINNDWELPEYEVQRPAGAYLVDTEPVNTMVLAITRAGKGKLARFV
mgnify:CR=1 FL=1